MQVSLCWVMNMLLENERTVSSFPLAMIGHRGQACTVLQACATDQTRCSASLGPIVPLSRRYAYSETTPLHARTAPTRACFRTCSRWRPQAPSGVFAGARSPSLVTRAAPHRAWTTLPLVTAKAIFPVFPILRYSFLRKSSALSVAAAGSQPVSGP